MRRLSGICGLLLFLAPVALRLATTAGDTDAMRCAIACGHAMGPTKGAACCPVSDAPNAGPTFKTCSRGADAAVPPLAPAPILLFAVVRLAPPGDSRSFDSAGRAVARSAFLRIPDKVPLRLA